MRLLYLALLSALGIADAILVINEIAPHGTDESICNGEDWVELLNRGDDVVDLTNYILHDDKGPDDEDAMKFGDASVGPGEFLLLCQKVDFEFGIGGDDIVGLISATGIPMSSIQLPGTTTEDVVTYALVDGETSEYKYTTTTTPGAANIFTEPTPLAEKLQQQEEIANDFFLRIENPTYAEVVDLSFTIDEESLPILDDHPYWQEFIPFETLSVSNAGETIALATSSGGKLRTKGQSTLVEIACLNTGAWPLHIKFETPFLGMETLYLRTYYGDESYMKEHAANMMLEAFGLPFMRSRPARLFINGAYRGFYLVLEAPTQGTVMQRSFGVFDPEKTALYKVKGLAGRCPLDRPNPLHGLSPSEEAILEHDTPANGTYYFERGRHRNDVPVLGMDFEGCNAFYNGNEQFNLGMGVFSAWIQEYNKNCSLAMTKVGQIDLAYGPSMEESIIDLFDKIYDESVDDITDSIDADQWLQNFAAYVILMNYDTPMGPAPNNWYIATTNGGGDWKIVQHDFNDIGTTILCSWNCYPRQLYHPILRPSCLGNQENIILGRVLNSEENIQKYLGYLQEYVDILNGGVLDKIYAYGNTIKEYAVEDPYSVFATAFSTVEEYEERELEKDLSDYPVDPYPPFLKTIRLHLAEIQKQLDAIQEGTLPLEDPYGPYEVCPDWRNGSSDDYLLPHAIADDCGNPECERVVLCYAQGDCGASAPYDMCTSELVSECKSCFPYSPCGTLDISTDSSTLIESEACGPELAEECAVLANSCYDETHGCRFDGEFYNIECLANSHCDVCYPNSRCSSAEGSEALPSPTSDESGVFAESKICGPELAECASASLCFDHLMGLCGEDGVIVSEDCQATLPFCEPCFPNSRCGGLVSTEEPPTEEAPTEETPETLVEEPAVEAIEEVEEVSADEISSAATPRVTVAVSWLVALAFIGFQLC